MAYLKSLEEKCLDSCGRKATVELINIRNASNGKYCRRCGNRALQRLNAIEAKNANPRRPKVI